MTHPRATDTTNPTLALQEFAKQEIRIAAVLNGGVSLAVWMSGVALEMHHLAMASQCLGHWDGYGEVLDALGATARVDVIAGTSAGGLNGAFLALGINRRRDFALLRDVWAQDGALEKLLRRPLETAPPSALAGDGYFLVRIQQALQAMVGSDNPDLDPAGTAIAPPVELILTGTLWQGRRSTYTDDMGVAITECDYDATFRFAGGQAGPSGKDDAGAGPPNGGCGNLDDASNAVLNQLAAAARCTSSFPGAFEPHYVRAGSVDDLTGRWASSAGQANFSESQYVIDGGVLMNKPVRPALDAIYRQPAHNQVRRVLGYVVPDPGDGGVPAPSATPARPPPVPDVPVATDVLLGVLTRLTSTDSVSRELSEIRDTNAAVRDHRKARARLCVAMATDDAQLAKALWSGYISERIDEASATVGALIYAGQPAGSGAWSVEELTAGLARVGSGPAGFGFVPRGSLDDALAGTGARWSWGQTTLSRLADMTIDLFKRAVMLAPLNQADTQGQIVALRVPLAATLDSIAAYGADLQRFWMKQGANPDRPPRRQATAADATGDPVTAGSADNLTALDAWLEGTCDAWDRAYGQDDGSLRHGRQYDGALALATALCRAREPIAAVLLAGNDHVDPSGGDRAQLDALCRWLLPDGAVADEVLRRMLQLDVVLLATAGALTDPEQEVQLVQISCGDRTRVTGMQLHHFGAFYRTPWRLNDWIEGRMDGARQLMRVLLDPDRLRQRGYSPDSLLIALHDVAVPVGDRDEAWLQSRWDGNLAGYRGEVGPALQPDASATALDLLADAVSLPGQLAALREDLSALADAIRAEGSDTAAGSRAWLAQYDAVVATAGRPDAGAVPSSALAGDQLWTLRQSMSLVGNQQIMDDIGSDTFARTVSHAAVVATGAFTPKTKLAHVRPVQVVLAALRGYVAMVYGMVAYLTRGSVVGTRAVELAVAAGGVLIAVTIFVPSVPIGLTLAGVLVLLTGASASALLTHGARGMGLRLLLAGLIVGGALGYLIWRDVDAYGWHGQVLSTLIKIGVGLLIVLLGWFVANGGTHGSSRR